MPRTDVDSTHIDEAAAAPVTLRPARWSALGLLIEAEGVRERLARMGDVVDAGGLPAAEEVEVLTGALCAMCDDLVSLTVDPSYMQELSTVVAARRSVVASRRLVGELRDALLADGLATTP